MEWLRHSKDRPKPCVQSSYNEKVYDLTDDAANWLVYFKTQNEHLLKNFKVINATVKLANYIFFLA